MRSMASVVVDLVAIDKFDDERLNFATLLLSLDWEDIVDAVRPSWFPCSNDLASSNAPCAPTELRGDSPLCSRRRSSVERSVSMTMREPLGCSFPAAVGVWG